MRSTKYGKDEGCVRLGNQDLDFENLNPDFPIECTLRSFGSCRIKGTDESLSRVDSSVPLMRHDPNDLRVHSIGKSGFRFSKSKSGFPNRTHPNKIFFLFILDCHDFMPFFSSIPTFNLQASLTVLALFPKRLRISI